MDNKNTFPFKSRIVINKDSREIPIKPLSARQFLDLFPLGMSEEEKDELAAEMERNHAGRHIETKDEKRSREILESAGQEGAEIATGK